jgi:hypothetical protein
MAQEMLNGARARKSVFRQMDRRETGNGLIEPGKERSHGRKEEETDEEGQKPVRQDRISQASSAGQGRQTHGILESPAEVGVDGAAGVLTRAETARRNGN